jgi:hypothetical protein
MMTGDLLQIRSLNGSQHFAFEELCCQLAALEPRPSGSIFVRKGPGADAGVECYVRCIDGSETGWQAKFFDEIGSSQLAQLTESFNQAIAKASAADSLLCLLAHRSKGWPCREEGKQKASDGQIGEMPGV